MKAKILGIAAILVILVAVIVSMWSGEESVQTDNQAGPGEAIEQNEE